MSLQKANDNIAGCECHENISNAKKKIQGKESKCSRCKGSGVES